MWTARWGRKFGQKNNIEQANRTKDTWWLGGGTQMDPKTNQRLTGGEHVQKRGERPKWDNRWASLMKINGPCYIARWRFLLNIPCDIATSEVADTWWHAAEGSRSAKVKVKKIKEDQLVMQKIQRWLLYHDRKKLASYPPWQSDWWGGSWGSHPNGIKMNQDVPHGRA